MDSYHRIIHAAIDVIREHGVRGLTIESVAVEAGMDVKEVDVTSSSKGMLLEGLMIYINRKRSPELDHLSLGLTTKDMFFHQYLRWVRFLYDEEDLFMVLEDLPTYYVEECTDVMPAFTLREIFQKCKEEQWIADGEIDEQLKLINSRLMGFIRWIHGEGQVLFDVYLVSHMNAVWELIRKKE